MRKVREVLRLRHAPGVAQRFGGIVGFFEDREIPVGGDGAGLT
jgi:hypothetical protein